VAACELAAALRGSAATVIKTIVFCEWSDRAVLTKLAGASQLLPFALRHALRPVRIDQRFPAVHFSIWDRR
jgi:hypothetical protein